MKTKLYRSYVMAKYAYRKIETGPLIDACELELIE